MSESSDREAEAGRRQVTRRAALGGLGGGLLAVTAQLLHPDATLAQAEAPEDARLYAAHAFPHPGGPFPLGPVVAPLPRQQHASVVLDGNLVLVTGGVYNDRHLASCQIFDPNHNAWHDAASLPIPRSRHSATRLKDGRVLVLAGWNGGPLADGLIYDPHRDVWSAARSLTAPRYDHTAEALSDGRVIVTGGFWRGTFAGAEIYRP
jgi:hypothetical protein